MTVILGEPMEIVRFHRPIYHSDETFWTEGLTTPWWWERPLSDNETITSRPNLSRPKHQGKKRVRLLREEGTAPTQEELQQP
jgi:hypothetical protein